MTLRVFGKLKEIITDHTQLENNFDNIGALKSHLEDQYPILSNMSYIIAIDKVICDDDATMMSDSEIALMPPFSGG